MQCLRCHSENRAGRRFCADCGVPLPQACASCGFVNESTEKFCGGCGAELTGAVTAAATASPSAASDAERRPITALFADLSGFTRLSQALDPEEVHRLLERYFDTVDAIVERWGGSVDKHIGDSVMAVFGAPVAHGDEALRAVRAAAEMHRAVPALGTELGHSLTVHIGIAAGEVIASGLGSAQHRAYTVIGNSVNLAARLLQLAGSGETVLDDAVHGGARGIARCQPIDDVHLRGIDAPLRVWRLLELVETASAYEGQAFVGRQGELAQLRTALQSSRASAKGAAVYVRGEAGMGKSRLVDELRQIALGEGFACHTGLVLDFGMAKGRDAIREIVGALLGLAPAAESGERIDATERALSQQRCTEAQRPFLIDLLDLPQPPASRALYEAMDNTARQRGRAAAVASLLRAASAERPVLLIVEDIHWADRITLNYLAELTQAVASLPAVLAMTSRLEGDPLDAAWRAAVRGCPLLTIDLGPLRAEESLQLAGGLFSTSNRFALRCIERAAGNPLFLGQLLRNAEEHEDKLPASLHSLVLARMDRLPERDRIALRAAAVIGQRFALSLVRHLAALPEYECSNLVAHHLVHLEGDEILFAHALIRDGVYASLTKTRRAELHRVAAEWFADRDPELRAEHLDRAEAPEAPQAYLLAARAQAAALHQERALTLADRGIALAREPADVFALNMLRGKLLREIGNGKPAIAAFEAAAAAAPDETERCRALLGIAAGHRLIAGVEAALAALAEAEPIARRNGLTRELTELHYIRGNVHFTRTRIDDCRTEHQASLVGARALQDRKWEARALSGLADADYAAGRLRTAFDGFVRCVDLCDTHGFARIAIANRVMIGHCRTALAEFDAGLADMRAAEATAIQVSNRHAEMFATQSIGFLLCACARYADAEPMLERALALATAVSARQYTPAILANQANVHCAKGDHATAREKLASALPLSREVGMEMSGAMILGLLAIVAADPAEREHHRAEAEALLAAGCLSHNYLHYYRYSIDDALARGEWARVHRHVDGLAAYTRDEPLPYTDFLMARGRVLATLAERPQDPRLRNEIARLQERADRLRWPIGWPDWALVSAAPRPVSA